MDAKRIKSRDFSLRIIGLYRFLIDNKAYDIGKQVLRCGTSIGANIAESECSESDSDFIHKLTSHLKKQMKQNIGWIYYGDQISSLPNNMNHLTMTALS